MSSERKRKRAFAYFASCPPGLEELLLDELKQLDAEQCRAGRGGVRFRADRETAYRVCLWSRLASRVSRQLANVAAADQQQLYDNVSGYSWERIIKPGMSIAVDFIGTSSSINNSLFGARRVKDAIVDRLRALAAWRPDVDLNTPDCRIIARLHRDQLTLALDLVGQALHQRGYRTDAGAAPLRETLAAAILVRTAWPAIHRSGGGFYDPVCGSGTLLIEAAMIATDRAPGLERGFAFENWPDHDAQSWRKLRAEARSRAERGLTLMPPMAGTDQDAGAIAQAQANLERAGFGERIRVCHAAVADERLPPGLSPDCGLLLANPPYGERLGNVELLRPLYRQLGELARNRLPNWHVALLSSNLELLKETGLPASSLYKFRNGALEVRLQLTTPGDCSARAERRESKSPRAEGQLAIPLTSGASMFANRLRKNRRRLKSWLSRGETDCYRLYDADIPEYAVTVDLYGDWVQICEYAPPASIEPAVAAARIGDVRAVVVEQLQLEASNIVVKRRQRQRGNSQYDRRDARQEYIEVQEGNARFLVNLHDYLDTGLFLDHRPLRRLLAQKAAGKRFLNLFCYTGTATVQAVLGGAAASVSVDLSASYLNWAQRNLDLNRISGNMHLLEREDCLRWLADCESRFDLILLDPPSFSNSKRMQVTLDVQRDHVALVRAALSLLSPQGELLFSTNRRAFNIDREALTDIAVEDISAASFDPDFSRDPRIHKLFLLRNPIVATS